jgi:hypothetical protein
MASVATRIVGLAATGVGTTYVSRKATREQQMSTDISIRPGSHVKVSFGMYDHHAIFCGEVGGENMVIEYAGMGGTGYSAIRFRPYDDFKRDRKVVLCSYPTNYSADEVIDRARSRMGEDEYDLVRNNCEHFAHWCTTGVSFSKQVNQRLNVCNTILNEAAYPCGVAEQFDSML